MDASNDCLNNTVRIQTLPVLLLSWYQGVKRDLPWRKTGDPYAIWVSEVMLQQTQVKTVIPYYERFLQRFTGVEQLGRANIDDVLTEWRGLGYYSRARRLWEGANYLIDVCGGEMPQDYDALIQVPGIGKYTAGAIASIAFGQRVQAIDGNVLRVMSRLLAWSEPVETARSYRHFSDHLALWQPALQPGDFNQALMELGALVCTPSKPNCGECPLNLACKGNLQDEVFHYPVKKIKAKRQIVTRLTYVLRRGDRVYLQKRPSQGLLANLWEFPGVELAEDNVLKDSLPLITGSEWFNYFQTAVSNREFDGWVREHFEKEASPHGPVWYTFSHRKWKMIWIIVDLPEHSELVPEKRNMLREASEQYWGVSEDWIFLQDLAFIALPVAFAAIVEDLKK